MTAFRQWWRRQPAGIRALIVIIVLAVGLRLFSSLVVDATGGSDPSGATGSSLSTAPDGMAAVASLLDENGVDVRPLRSSLAGATIPTNSTLVIADAELDERSLEAVETYVRGGGRLVLVGESSLDIAAYLGVNLAPRTGRDENAVAVGSEPETAGVEKVTAPIGRFSSRRFMPLLEADGGLVAGKTTLGSGELIIVASSTPFDNKHLADVDNALFALNTFGGAGPVHFAEEAHGYGTSGIGAIPGNWQLMLFLAVAAAAILVWSRGKRLGPVEQPHLLPTPPRMTYVASLATTLARTEDFTASGTVLAERVRQAVIRRAGLTPEATADEIRRAAHELGYEFDDIELGIRPPDTIDDVMALSRAVVRLTTRAEVPQ